MRMPYERFAVTMAQNSTLASESFAMNWVLNTSFRVSIRLPKMVWWKGKTEPCVRWLGRCSTRLREGSGLRRSILHAMCRIGFTLGFTRRKPVTS
jgi:hypothetical protein